MVEADALLQAIRRVRPGLVPLPGRRSQPGYVVLQPQQAVGGDGRGGERACAGAGPGDLTLSAAQQADDLDHGAGRGIAVRGPQDEGDDRAAEPGRVQNPPRRLDQGPGASGPHRPPVHLITQPGVPGQQPVRHPEGPQFPGRPGGGRQRKQVIAQAPGIGEVVVGPLLHPGRYPVGHGRCDGEQRNHDQRRPDQGKQDGCPGELDGRADHPQRLRRRGRQGPAALAQRVDLGQVIRSLEELQERRVAGQAADMQPEAACNVNISA
jgi:hypothetical protein